MAATADERAQIIEEERERQALARQLDAKAATWEVSALGARLRTEQRDLSVLYQLVALLAVLVLLNLGQLRRRIAFLEAELLEEVDDDGTD